MSNLLKMPTLRLLPRQTLKLFARQLCRRQFLGTGAAILPFTLSHHFPAPCHRFILLQCRNLNLSHQTSSSRFLPTINPWYSQNKRPTAKDKCCCPKHSSSSSANILDSSETSEKTNSSKIKELLEAAASFQDQKPLSSEDIWTTPAYPVVHEHTTSDPVQPKTDPQDMTILLFPGQGLQFVGMGENLLQYPNVKEMYTVASEILGYDLLRLSLTGPKSELDRTQHCQPATVVASLAAVEKLRDEKPQVIETCVAAAGFSVGEITALVFAGVLTFEDAIRLIKVRGTSMQQASEATPSGMMTVFYRPNGRVNFACMAAREWCIRKGIEDATCSIANYLFPQCKVIAGNVEALEFIELNAKKFGIHRYKHLPVSGAFHTALMKPARKQLQQAMKAVRFSEPLIPVYSNVTGHAYRDAGEVQELLADQLCKPVKWEQTLHYLYQRPEGRTFPQTYECGPGQSLRAILKMVNAKARENAFEA